MRLCPCSKCEAKRLNAIGNWLIVAVVGGLLGFVLAGALGWF